MFKKKGFEKIYIFLPENLFFCSNFIYNFFKNFLILIYWKNPIISIKESTYQWFFLKTSQKLKMKPNGIKPSTFASFSDKTSIHTFWLMGISTERASHVYFYPWKPESQKHETSDFCVKSCFGWFVILPQVIKTTVLGFSQFEPYILCIIYVYELASYTSFIYF